MSKKEPIKINTVIEKLIKNTEKKRKEFKKKEDLVNFLEEKFLPGISSHVEFGSVRKKITLRVDNPIWMQEVNFRRNELISLINEFFGKDKVKEICIKKG